MGDSRWAIITQFHSSATAKHFLSTRQNFALVFYLLGHFHSSELTVFLAGNCGQ